MRDKEKNITVFYIFAIVSCNGLLSNTNPCFGFNVIKTRRTGALKNVGMDPARIYS